MQMARPKPWGAPSDKCMDKFCELTLRKRVLFLDSSVSGKCSSVVVSGDRSRCLFFRTAVIEIQKRLAHNKTLLSV